MKSLFESKRGDIPSLIYIVVILGVIAFVFIFTSKLSHQLNTQMEIALNSSPEFENSSAIPAIQTIRDVNDWAYDYAFLALYIGSLIALGLTAYSTRISPVFYWVYALMSLAVLAVGVLISNTWQAATETEMLSDTVARFPITDFLLGSYYPLAVTALILITMILLFGKTPETGGSP